MKPLIVLLGTSTISFLILKMFQGVLEPALSARIGMAAMLLFTAIGHFKFTKGMAMMLPEFIPYRLKVVYVTGLIEVAAAIGLLIPGLKLITGWLLIVFFILILPANIYAATRKVDYERAVFDGPGLKYLWFRIPLQLLFIAWVYFSSIQH